MTENNTPPNGDPSKKRKLDTMDGSGSEVSPVCASVMQDLTSFQAQNAAASSSSSNVPSNGATSEDPETEIRRLEGALQKADETIRQMQAAREAIAGRLNELGRSVVVKPWTQEHLKTVVEHHLDEFQAEYALCDDVEGLPDDAKEDAIRILKMRRAIYTGFQSDGTGYRDADGTWIDFEPTQEDLRAFKWEDADSLW